MFEKIEVNGDGACELYKLLKSKQSNEDGTSDIQWNFTKFLVDGPATSWLASDRRTTPEEIAERRLPKYL